MVDETDTVGIQEKEGIKENDTQDDGEASGEIDWQHAEGGNTTNTFVGSWMTEYVGLVMNVTGEVSN